MNIDKMKSAITNELKDKSPKELFESINSYIGSYGVQPSSAPEFIENLFMTGEIDSNEYLDYYYEALNYSIENHDWADDDGWMLQSFIYMLQEIAEWSIWEAQDDLIDKITTKYPDALYDPYYGGNVEFRLTDDRNPWVLIVEMDRTCGEDECEFAYPKKGPYYNLFVAKAVSSAGEDDTFSYKYDSDDELFNDLDNVIEKHSKKVELV